MEELFRGDVGVSLGRLDAAMSQHSAHRFDGNATFQGNQGRKSVATDVCRKGNRDTSPKLQGFELNEIS